MCYRDIGLHNQKQDYILNNKAIEKSDCEKDLGVNVDPLLTFERHINQVCNKGVYLWLNNENNDMQKLGHHGPLVQGAGKTSP